MGGGRCVNGQEQAIGSIYVDPDASRRFRAFLRRWLLVLIVVAVLGPLITTVLVGQRNARSAELSNEARLQDDLAIAALLAIAPRDGLPDLLGAAGLDAVVSHPDGTFEVIATQPTLQALDSGTLDTWRSTVVRAADRTDSRIFVSDHADGTKWEHHRVAAPGGRQLITAVEASNVPSPASDPLIAAWLGLAAVVAGLGVWLFLLDRRVVRPLQTMLDAIEDLRVRGEIRDEVRSEIRSISHTPIEIHRMSGLLLDIEEESQRESLQSQALLRSASTLGGSLNEQTVMQGALERLQDLLQIDRAAILRYDPHANRFEVLAMRGHTEEWVEAMTLTAGEVGQPSLLALRDGEPNHVVDTEASFIPESIRARARRFGYRSILALPLSEGLGQPTAMVLQSDQPRTYSFDDIQLTRSFASIASAALRNAELFGQTDDRLREQTSRLESIVESVEHGLLVEDRHQKLLYINPVLRRLTSTQHTPSSIEAFIEDVVRANDLDPMTVREIAELGLGEASWVDVDLRAEREDVARVFRIRSFDVRDGRGRTIGRGHTWTDISRDQALERMKSGLLAAVSHEFRTPLALIKGYATTLLADDVAWNRADQTEFLRMVSGEADRLTDLVQRILDMRRIDAGMLHVEKMAVDFDVVIEATLASTAHHSDRTIVREFAPLVVEIDAARVTTALRNLVENACKYSPPDQPVEVAVAVEGNEVMVTVRDYGPGVAPEMRDRIFDTFVRGEVGLGTSQGGVGLGLAIGKGFIAAHGGTMFLREPTEGPGSIFGFVLPGVREMATQE